MCVNQLVPQFDKKNVCSVENIFLGHILGGSKEEFNTTDSKEVRSMMVVEILSRPALEISQTE